MKRIAFAALLAAIAATGASAQSGTYSFTYTTAGGVVETGSLGGVLDGDGNHFVVSSNGSFTYNGAAFVVSANPPVSVDAVTGYGPGLQGDNTATMTLDASYLDYFSGDFGAFVAFARGDAFQIATQAPFSQYYIPGVLNDVDTFDASRFHASFQADGAVPEPASWALMLGGFGMVGGAMRSRKRSSAVSFG